MLNSFLKYATLSFACGLLVFSACLNATYAQGNEGNSAAQIGSNIVPKENSFSELAAIALDEAMPFADTKTVGQKAAKRIFISSFSASGDEGGFILLHIEGEIFCGTHGCMNILLKEDGGGYVRLPMTIVANRPIYRKKCDDKISLVFSPGGGSKAGYSEWVYEDGSFKFYKNFSSLDASSACT